MTRRRASIIQADVARTIRDDFAETQHNHQN